MPRPRDIFEIKKYNNCSEYARITARSSERTLEEFLHVDAGCAGGKDDCGREAYSFYGISSCRCHVERTEWVMKGWMMGLSPRSRECDRLSDLPLQSGYVYVLETNFWWDLSRGTEFQDTDDWNDQYKSRADSYPLKFRRVHMHRLALSKRQPTPA